ncbi:MAG: respiratory nitrate reductase subunit gamma [Nitrospinae bacterium]|nr:respiratory nitrate reductase subunit gamma [Nitrospinota bacterium]
MSALTLFYVGTSYLCAAVFFGGLSYRLAGYAATPSPLRIPLTPQATTVFGVIKKNAVSMAVFRALFIGERWTWVGGYSLHVIFVFVFLRHLRLFINPVPEFLVDLQPLALLFAALLPLPVLFLISRRMYVDRYRYISSGADYFALVLLLVIGLSGLALKFVSHSDLVGVKEFLLGLVLLSPVEMPSHPAFMLHFSLVLLLGFYFPFSKLVHAGGVFLSPTTTQVEDNREQIHANPRGGN